MVTEDYVSFETAKLLKEKGFRLWCFNCYGVAVLHNGADISFDEECDLKDYGRENEIEYVEGDRLFDYGCDNRMEDAKVWAAPTLWVAMKWLREVHGLYVVIKPYVTEDGILSLFEIKSVKEKDIVSNIRTKTGFNSYEDACDAAIKFCLENLI